LKPTEECGKRARVNGNLGMAAARTLERPRVKSLQLSLLAGPKSGLAEALSSALRSVGSDLKPLGHLHDHRASCLPVVD
jgi:hypothetical protein